MYGNTPRRVEKDILRSAWADLTKGQAGTHDGLVVQLAGLTRQKHSLAEPPNRTPLPHPNADSRCNISL